ALFISGTASIVGHETVHLGDVRAQTHETLRNLAAVIAAANARTSAVFELSRLEAVVYVRHVSDAPIVREVLDEVLGTDAHTVRQAV
ncbi:hypothetical protein Q8G47_28955, partial [Klebsiella pneumoniae]|uniref:hypothetical protein n=1 Tax=Klebsiella pneumoniae TaxID=573 RepID=UPI0030137C4C